MGYTGKICAVCGRVLDEVEGAGWVHTIPDRMFGEDHPAVPVDHGDVPIRGRCDFCMDEDPTWELPVSDFDLFAVPGHGSKGGWAACDKCARLIESNQWNGLFRRAKDSWEDRHGPMSEIEESGVRRLYRQLRKHILGPLRPIS